MKEGENKIRDSAKNIGMNYTHLTIVFNEWAKEGIINKVRKDNYYSIELTKKGKEICKCLENLKRAIDIEPEEEDIVKQEEVQASETQEKSGDDKNE